MAQYMRMIASRQPQRTTEERMREARDRSHRSFFPLSSTASAGVGVGVVVVGVVPEVGGVDAAVVVVVVVVVVGSA